MGQRSKSNRSQRNVPGHSSQDCNGFSSDSDVTARNVPRELTGWSHSPSVIDFSCYKKFERKVSKKSPAKDDQRHRESPNLSELVSRPKTMLTTEEWVHRPNSTGVVVSSIAKHLFDEAGVCSRSGSTCTCTCMPEDSSLLEDYEYSIGKCGNTEVLPTIAETSSGRASSLASIEIHIPMNSTEVYLRTPSPQPYQYGADIPFVEENNAFIYINDEPYSPKSRQANRITASETRRIIRRQSQPNYNLQHARDNQTPSFLPPLQPDNQKIKICRKEQNLNTCNKIRKGKQSTSVLKQNKTTGKLSAKKIRETAKKETIRAHNQKCFICYTDWFAREIIKRKIQNKDNQSEITNLRNLLKRRLKYNSSIDNKTAAQPKKKSSKNKLKPKADFKGLEPWLNPRLSETILWPITQQQTSSPCRYSLEDPLHVSRDYHLIETVNTGVQEISNKTALRLPGLKSSPSRRKQQERRSNRRGQKVTTMPRSTIRKT